MKEESLRESSSRFGQSNSNRAALKEARDLELAKIESLRMSNTASRGFVRKKSLRRLSSEEQMQSFKKESKHMAPQMLRQLVPVTADRGIRNAFDQYDQSRTGVISKDEFARMVSDFILIGATEKLGKRLNFLMITIIIVLNLFNGTNYGQ